MKVYGYEISPSEDRKSIIISQPSIGEEYDYQVELSVEQLPYLIQQLKVIIDVDCEDVQ